MRGVAIAWARPITKAQTSTSSLVRPADIASTLHVKCERLLRNSATGTRTRVARVRAEYPNQLDYSGVVPWSRISSATNPKGENKPSTMVRKCTLFGYSSMAMNMSTASRSSVPA